jgi:hypothetical protein
MKLCGLCKYFCVVFIHQSFDKMLKKSTNKSYKHIISFIYRCIVSNVLLIFQQKIGINFQYIDSLKNSLSLQYQYIGISAFTIYLWQFTT